MDTVKELNDLWHIIGMRMKAEMSSEKYSSIAGLSMVELSILQIIEKQPNCMMKDISNQLCLPKSTFTSAITRLENKGYIMRKQDIGDKRAYNLELTKLGTQAQQEHLDIEYTVFRNFLKPLNNKEKDLFIKIFAKAINTSR